MYFPGISLDILNHVIKLYVSYSFRKTTFKEDDMMYHDTQNGILE